MVDMIDSPFDVFWCLTAKAGCEAADLVALLRVSILLCILIRDTSPSLF